MYLISKKDDIYSVEMTLYMAWFIKYSALNVKNGIHYGKIKLKKDLLDCIGNKISVVIYEKDAEYYYEWANFIALHENEPEFF